MLILHPFVVIDLCLDQIKQRFRDFLELVAFALRDLVRRPTKQQQAQGFLKRVSGVFDADHFLKTLSQPDCDDDSGSRATQAASRAVYFCIARSKLVFDPISELVLL